jgi:serine/threonine protein kinase
VGLQVYKGRYLKKLVAIKVLTENSPEQQEAFVAETMLLRDLRHPHIVQYLGHTQLAGNVCHITTNICACHSWVTKPRQLG